MLVRSRDTLHRTLGECGKGIGSGGGLVDVLTYGRVAQTRSELAQRWPAPSCSMGMVLLRWRTNGRPTKRIHLDMGKFLVPSVSSDRRRAQTIDHHTQPINCLPREATVLRDVRQTGYAGSRGAGLGAPWSGGSRHTGLTGYR